MSARLLTARQVAEQLGVSTETVLRWVRSGKLAAFRLPGGALRFQPDTLDDWLSARSTGESSVISPATPKTRPQNPTDIGQKCYSRGVADVLPARRESVT